MTSALSPTLAGKLSAQLFFRTTRPPLRPADAEVLDRAHELAVPFQGRALRVWVWGDPPGLGTNVLLVHGWSGRAGQMTALVDPLLARGARVVAFDAPAHGASPGQSTTIPEMAASIAAVSAQVGGVEAILAHSLGCVAATFALSRGLGARRIGYLAPPVDPELWLGRFGDVLGLPPAAVDAMRRSVQARVGLALEDLLHTRLARDMTLPLLVVHDDEDREVRASDGRALALAWPSARLERTRGLGHNRILRDQAVVRKLSEFALPTPGSG